MKTICLALFLSYIASILLEELAAPGSKKIIGQDKNSASTSCWVDENGQPICEQFGYGNNDTNRALTSDGSDGSEQYGRSTETEKEPNNYDSEYETGHGNNDRNSATTSDGSDDSDTKTANTEPLVLDITTHVDQPFRKGKDTVTDGDIPNASCHGLECPAPKHMKPTMGGKNPSGNPNGAGEHVMSAIKSDAEKFPSEIAGEFVEKSLKKIKEIPADLQDAARAQRLRVRRNIDSKKRAFWDELNRIRRETKAAAAKRLLEEQAVPNVPYLV